MEAQIAGTNFWGQEKGNEACKLSPVPSGGKKGTVKESKIPIKRKTTLVDCGV